MLQRDIDVVGDVGQRCHRFGKALGHVAGIGVHEAQPRHFGDGVGQALEQRG